MQLQNCDLCPRNCGINRLMKSGSCGVDGEKIRVGKASIHMWEEPCISGHKGSGTIFFAGCNLKCIYCQNSSLSRDLNGVDITIEQLANTMIDLQQKGAHNINLVTPTHYSLQICLAVKLARNLGLKLPIVYNTSGYESVAAIHSLADTVSVYLTDFKYADNVLSKQFSGVSDYYEVALDALHAMVQQVGNPVFDDDQLLVKGVIVRHLVLPGHVQNSKDVLTKLYTEFGDRIIISIMNQYTPIGNFSFDELNRCVSSAEYDSVISHAISLGITNAFVQDGGTQSESFIPDFDGEGICK